MADEKQDFFSSNNLHRLSSMELQPESTPFYPNLSNHQPQFNGYTPSNYSIRNLPLMEVPESSPSPFYPHILTNNGSNANPSINPNPYLEDPGFQYPSNQYLYTDPSAGYGNIFNGGVGVGGGIGGRGLALGNNPAIDYSIGSGFSRLSALPYDRSAAYENDNLRRMRIESAVRGQIGFDNQGMGLQDLDPSDVDHLAKMVSQLAVSQRARNGFQSPSYDFSNGVPKNSVRVDTNFNTNRTRFIEGFGSENSRVSMSAVYNNVNNNNAVIRSQLPRLNTSSSLNDLRGQILSIAKDQNGCRFLQHKFDEGKLEDIEIIFSEVNEHVRELMVDQFGNYLIQKLFDVCNVDQLTQLLLRVCCDDRRLMAICLDMHGTRAIQRLLENLTTSEQRNRITSILSRITIQLAKSMYGHHVIQYCLKLFSSEENQQILNVIATNCLEIATDKSGCCVLQQFIEHADGEQKQRFVADITANAVSLSENAFANYVVQYLLGRDRNMTAEILAQLRGHHTELSMNKYGSNVVEKCIKDLDYDLASSVIDEIVGSRNFLMVLQDPFGNYVCQYALSRVKGSLREHMLHQLEVHYPYLHSHPHGKRVLARLRGGSKQRI